MDKITILQHEIEDLRKKQIELHSKYNEYQHEIVKRSQEMGYLIQQMQGQKPKRTTPFTLYTQCPSFKALCAFEMRGWKSLPYFAQGQFEVRELAEMIKQFYQFERERDYDIITIGIINRQEEVIHKDLIFKETLESLHPYLYFIIGRKDLVARFKVLDGHFINSEKLANVRNWIEHAHGKNVITISVQSTDQLLHALEIECLTDSIYNKPNHINYYDYLTDTHVSCLFNKYQQIIISDLRTLKLNNVHHYKSNRDLINFEIYQEDNFIANILTSICLYKQQNKIWQLNRDDYQHIFEELYGEKVDIVNLAEQDRIRTLKYVQGYNTK